MNAGGRRFDRTCGFPLAPVMRTRARPLGKRYGWIELFELLPMVHTTEMREDGVSRAFGTDCRRTWREGRAEGSRGRLENDAPSKRLR